MQAIQHFIQVHSVIKYSGKFGCISDFQEALNLVNHYRIKAEIIGQWIYCFTTDLIGVQLLAIGFWYSFKHRAYVYSGRRKGGPADDENLDEIRARLGSRAVRG